MKEKKPTPKNEAEIRVGDGNPVREADEIPEHCDGNVRIVLERVRDERE